MKIAINGFGRIGRMTLRALQHQSGIEVVAINDLTDIDTLAHLFKYDTAHGRFSGEVSTEDDILIVNGKRITMLQEKDPAKLPWASMQVDAIIESTGRFTDKSTAFAHINAGAKKVLITAPATGCKNDCSWCQQ